MQEAPVELQDPNFVSLVPSSNLSAWTFGAMVPPSRGQFAVKWRLLAGFHSELQEQCRGLKIYQSGTLS